MPSRSRTLPKIWMRNREKKLLRALMSPSMRSIISPGVWALWKLMSRRKQCLARSLRRAFVAVQLTISLT